MRKSHLLLGLLTATLALFGTMSLSSCGSDDEDGDPESQKYWLTGTVRSKIDTLNATFEGLGFSYPMMRVIEFHKDYTASAYELYKTDLISLLEKAYEGDKPKFDGTWTKLEGHPEWSYFNGTLIHFAMALSTLVGGEGSGSSIVDAGYDYVMSEEINPKQLKYTVNFENGCVKLIDPTDDKDGWYNTTDYNTLYMNLNASKSAWTELRNVSGKLMFIIWDPNVTLDNSAFDK